MSTLPLSFHESAISISRTAPPRLKISHFLFLFTQILLMAAIPTESVFGATSASKPRASAEGISGSNVELNGARMEDGATLFPGDVVMLGAASSVALQFETNLVLAAPETVFMVETEGVSLRSGRIQIRANGADSFGVSGPFFHVSVVPSGRAPGSSEIQVWGTRAQVSSLTGVAEITADGREVPYELRAGEMATLDAAGGGAAPGGQDASGPAAGQVSRLLPEVQIDRASRQLIAAVSSPIFWNDDLHSGSTGRAHITLTDGSLLNLGSNSSLRILQHDAQAQQTSLDLVIGRMRGQVLKLTRPGSKFEIHTPVGAAGLVGTDFSLEVTNDYVELMVFEGIVRFTIFSNGQAINVNAGMVLRISRTGAFESPKQATPQEIQLAKSLTDIAEAPIQQAAEKKKRRVVPVVIWVSTATAVGAITFAVYSHATMSPTAP